MGAKKVVIMGAAGRDFHNFNVIYRDKRDYEVIAFTATQIPDIDDRKYPAELAGKLYPNGIPIYAEDEIVELIQKHRIDEVVFSYSDISYDYVMSRAAVVNAAGADFKLLSVIGTMIESEKPVVAVCAARTGSGKSQTTRRICEILKEMGYKVVAVRHPMPYGDLVKQACQRFARIEDLKKYDCTIEEMEEYEPHINRGQVVYAGVDYGRILSEAEKEADIIVWDGGNNDTAFYKPDLLVTVADPLRPGHEMLYYPGGTNILLSDVVLINKVDTAHIDDINMVRDNVMMVNSDAVIIEGASPISVNRPDLIRDKKVLVIEDGPTLTHGEMTYGAGVIAAQKFGAEDIVDPRLYTVNSIAETFEKYPEIGALLPAMGYGEQQMKDLEETIARVECDTVVIATPIDLRRVIDIKQPSVRVSYELQEIGHPNLTDVLELKFGRKKRK
jgi:predicted GTPase